MNSSFALSSPRSDGATPERKAELYTPKKHVRPASVKSYVGFYCVFKAKHAILSGYLVRFLVVLQTLLCFHLLSNVLSNIEH